MFERKVQQQRITKSGEVRCDGYLDVLFRMEAPEFGDDTLCDVTQIDDGFAHDVACDASELKQAVEQGAHVLGCFDDALKIGGRLFVELFAKGVEDDLGKSSDASQGSAEIMREGVTKYFEFFAPEFGLSILQATGLCD